MNLQELLAANPNPTITVLTKEVAPLKGPERRFQFSASQIDKFRECKRKWGFDKIDRVPFVQSESAALGNEVHALREKWLRDGILPEGDDYASKCARAGIEHLPMPGVSHVEGKIFKDADLPGHEANSAFWMGYIDFSIDDQGAAGYYPPELTDWPDVNGVPLVGDHKTTASKEYIKTVDYLLDHDPQGAMYSMYVMDKLGVDVADLFWHFIVKNKKPKPIPVRIRASRERITASYLKVLNDASLMKTIIEDRSITKAMDIEPNPKACDNYGGCPHRASGRCQLTMQQKIGALKMSEGDLAAKLAAQAGAAVPQNTPAQPAPTGGLAALQSAMQTGVVVNMPAQATQAPPAQAPTGALAALMNQAPPAPPAQATQAPPAQATTAPPAQATTGALAAMMSQAQPAQATQAPPAPPAQASPGVAQPTSQPGALAAMMSGQAPTNPVPVQTVAEAAQALTEAQKVAQVSAAPPPVSPPDAPPADLNAELPAADDKKAKKATSRQSALDKRREAIASAVLGPLAAHFTDKDHAVTLSVALADKLIAELAK